MDFFVSPHGNDCWSGRLPAPNRGKTDGPWATIGKARDAVRELKLTGRLDGSVTVHLRGGRYPIEAPIVFTPEDSAPVTYAAYRGEKPVLFGGAKIEGWRVEKLNGRDVWVANLPRVASGQWRFRSLFVDGRRRPRARMPKKGFYRVAAIPEDGLRIKMYAGHLTDRFVCRPGEIKTWKNLGDVEVVVLHYWTDDRLPIASFDPATNTARFSRVPTHPFSDDWANPFARYYVENILEALSEPGEWCLDRRSGRLCYLPMKGETPGKTEVVAPVAEQFLKLEGRPDEGRFVEFLRFEGLTFLCADWHQPDCIGAPSPYPGCNMSGASQAWCNLGGAIRLEGARNCAVEDCEIRGAGFYAVELADGCTGNRIVGNEIADIGAGGVKMNGSDAKGPAARRTGNNRITDNRIHACGRIFHGAVGVLSMHSFGNVIAHNHIHDMYYTGVSVGWVWGYADSVSKNNLIERNHIHDLGHGWLSDMGGIYTLGVQPGTVIRGNVIHDIVKSNYGGWAIYPDEGSSHIVIEDNVCYDANATVFHQHYGRENVVRNNIFAFGAEGIAQLSRAADHISLTFERNLFVTDGQPIQIGGYNHRLGERKFLSDLNLFWDVSGKPPLFGRKGKKERALTMSAWRKTGRDTHSVVADPIFRNLKARDFRLGAGSPAVKLGFLPIDVSDAGPRPKSKRE